jgi:hypothetical protein
MPPKTKERVHGLLSDSFDRSSSGEDNPGDQNCFKTCSLVSSSCWPLSRLLGDKRIVVCDYNGYYVELIQRN